MLNIVDARNDRDNDFITGCCMRENTRLTCRVTIASLLTPNGGLLRDPKEKRNCLVLRALSYWKSFLLYLVSL